MCSPRCAPSTSGSFVDLRRLRNIVNCQLSARRRPRARWTTVVSAQRGPPRRLLPFVLSTPKRLDAYFEASPPRRVLWCLISGGAGFYAFNIVTLSFGALAVNDVLASVVCVIFYEAVSALFYRAGKPSLRLWFANYFKVGVVAAAMVEAVKLGG